MFFDALKIEWQYEPEGFDLPSGPYLPDFYLPAHDVYVEVKGRPATPRERTLAEELAMETSAKRVILFEGDIPREHRLPWFTPLAYDFHDSPGVWTPWPLAVNSAQEIQAALNAARSARFEHGEQG